MSYLVETGLWTNRYAFGVKQETCDCRNPCEGAGCIATIRVDHRGSHVKQGFLLAAGIDLWRSNIEQIRLFNYPNIGVHFWDR